MRKRTFSSKLFLLLGTAAILGFSACTDNDYDFNEIDSTIGIGGDGLEIPSMSTEIIPLKDVLELEENGSVIEDELTGDYVFRQDGADVAPVHPFIDKITVAEQTSTSNDVELVFSTPSGSRRRSRATRAGGESLVADGWLQAFTWGSRNLMGVSVELCDSKEEKLFICHSMKISSEKFDFSIE